MIPVVKKALILSKYYGRAVWRRLRTFKPVLFIIVFAATFYFALSYIAGRRPESAHQSPKIFIVSGSIMRWDHSPSLSTIVVPQIALCRPVSGAIVEVGNYRTVTDSRGSYSLAFRSPSKENIFLIIRTKSGDHIERIEFSDSETQIQRNVTY